MQFLPSSLARLTALLCVLHSEVNLVVPTEGPRDLKRISSNVMHGSTQTAFGLCGACKWQC